MSVEQLLEKYKQEKDNLSSYQLAKLENDIWEALKPVRATMRNKRGKRYQIGEYFAQEFGVSKHEPQRRFALYLQGEWVKALWSEIDKGLSIHAAEIIMRKARDLAEDYSVEARQKALATVLAKRNPAKQPDTKQPDTKQLPPGKDEETIRKWHLSRKFTADLEEIVNNYLDKLLGENIPVKDKGRLKDDFVKFVAIATEDFRKEVRKCERLAKEESDRRRKIGKKRLDYACEVLGIRCKFGQPPEGGWDNARVVFARRVEPLHPDKGHNNPAMVEEYQRVVEAYNMVKEYRSQLES